MTDDRQPEKDSARSLQLEGVFRTAAQMPDAAAVEHLVTHCSEIFLTGDRAYKMKRAIRLAFLDYSTLELRERACRAELDANAGARDALYLGVRPIRRALSGALFLDADMPSPLETIDWVVEMRRFDRAQEFDRLLEADQFQPPVINALADIIAKAHLRAAPNSDWGRTAHHAKTIDDMAGALSDLAPDDAAGWAEDARLMLERLSPKIEARRRRGKVRRLHGDLHLGNIVLLDGPKGARPTPFDAIEFSDRVAVIDCLYDIAFTAADLKARGRADFANLLMNRYLSATRDYGGLILWPLFVSIRLAIRAMAAHLNGADGDAHQRLELARETLRRANRVEQPRLIAVGGLSGSGKTTLARRLAAALQSPLGVAHLSSDVIRKRLYGAPPEQRLPAAAYNESISGRVHHRLFRDAERALRAGASVVLDATFTDRRARAQLAALGRRIGIRPEAIWLDAPEETRIDRVTARTGDASDISPALARAQRIDAALDDWTRIAAVADPDKVFTAAMRLLGDRMMRAPPTRAFDELDRAADPAAAAIFDMTDDKGTTK